MRVLVAALLLLAPLAAQESFFPFSIDQDRVSGAPDFSSLNRPLGPADRLFVRDGHFYAVGRDGKPHTADDARVKLFGVNLAFGGNFPEENDAVRIARRLRRLGVNLVRLHHMDTNPDRDPETCNSLLTTGPYPTLNPVAVKRLRRFLTAMREEGIYANLNLHVGYAFRPEVDRVPPMPAGAEFPTHSKPLHVFHPRMVALQGEYARKVIAALELRDDVVLGMVEINNESGLADAWQRNMFPRTVVGEYAAELDGQWKRWKKDGAPEYIEFLIHTDRVYLNRIRDVVRAAANPLVPIAGTQLCFGGLANVASHDGLDFQDHHFYIDHYNFPNRRWDSRDWRIRDTSSVATGLATFLNMAAGRVAGMPYTISEFNQNYPNRHANEIDPTFAAFAALQDWDAVVHFAYAHNRAWDGGKPSGFDLNGDWGKWVSFGQSAWLFRTGAVAAANHCVQVGYSPESIRRATQEKRLGNIAKFLQETAGYDPSLALRHRVELSPKAAAKLPSPGAPPYVSDTGELWYDPAAKLFTLAAPQAAGVFGFTGGKAVQAGALQIGAGAHDYVTILATALDGQPIAKSRRLLLGNPGYTLGTQPGSNPPRMQKIVNYPGAADWFTLESDDPSRPSGPRGADAPTFMKKVDLTVTLTGGAATVYPLDGTGARMAPLPPGKAIRLNAAAPWYEVVR